MINNTKQTHQITNLFQLSIDYSIYLGNILYILAE